MLCVAATLVFRITPLALGGTLGVEVILNLHKDVFHALLLGRERLARHGEGRGSQVGSPDNGSIHLGIPLVFEKYLLGTCFQLHGTTTPGV